MRVRNLVWTFAVTVAAGLALGPARARACSPCVEASSFDVVPGPGTPDVPTNTRIWLGAGWSYLLGDDPTIELRGEAGTVEFRRSTIAWQYGSVGASSLVVLTPTAPLAPRTRYRFELDDRVIEFETGDGPDLEAPPAPRARPVTAVTEDGGRCGEPRYAVVFEVDGAASVRVFDVGRTARLDERAPAGTVSEAELQPGERADVGRGGCWSNWDGADAGAATEVRFGSFDLAGNFSGWSAPAVARVPGADGGGCSAAAGFPGTGIALALAAWVVARRGASRA